MDRNRYVVTAKEHELFAFVLMVVEHGFAPPDALSATDATDGESRGIATWISQHVRRIDRTMKPIDWRQLRKVLREHDCVVGAHRRNFITIERHGKSIHLAYGGDDREVSKATLAKIQRDLGLRDDLAFDSDVFYGRADRIDRFIVKFRGVLEKLADA